MSDLHKTKKELAAEIEELRRRLAEAEAASAMAAERIRAATERSGAERQRFFDLLDRLPIFAYLQSPDYGIEFANKYFIKQYGEPGRRKCHEVMWGRTEPCEDCPTFRVFETGEPQVWQSHHPDDGRTYEVHDYPFPDVDGSPLVLEISRDVSDQMRFHEALKESDIRYSMVHMTSFDAIIIADSSGRIVEYNPSTASMFGYEDTELIGRELITIIPDEYRERHVHAFENYLKTRTPVVQGRVSELKGLRKNGESFPIELLVSSFESRGQIYFTGTIRDITARRAAEEKQLDQLSLMQTLIETIPSPVFYKGADGRYLGCNRAFEEFIGMSREKIVGRTAYDIAPKELADRYHEMDTALFADPGVQVYESPVRYADGELHDIIFNKATFEEQGRTAGLIGVMLDVTEIKRSKEALEESEARWRTVSENSGDYIMIADTEGRLEYVNRLSPGVSEDEVIGRPITDFVPERFRPEIMACIQRVLTSGAQDSFATDYIMADGEVRHFEARVGPKKRDGHVVALTISATDVTERRRAEAETEKLKSALMQSQKMEAIGTLAGGIAHDFNNVLTVVKSLTGLMMNRVAPNDPLYEYIKPISESAARGINLIQQLLLFSSNRSSEPAVMSLNKAARDITDMLTHLVSENIAIDTDFQRDLWDISADRSRVDQIISNLVINSSEAMPLGGKLSIRTENIEKIDAKRREIFGAPPGRYVCVTISDTGVGMGPGVMEHIFEPFFTSGKANGTGMGLAVVYGIVKDLKGLIEVESDLGSGTTFRIYLPATESHEQSSASETRSYRKANGDGRRILIVEDDMWVRRSTAMVLKDNGYEVFEAESAEEALALFYREKGRFDLVLSDIVMPGRSGLQLVSPLLDINPRVPVLLCSSHLDERAPIDQIMKRGLSYIQKPFDIPDLLQAVEETMSHG